MSYRITHVRLSPSGSTVEHITDVKGHNDSDDREFKLSVSDVIKYLKNNYSFYVKVDRDSIAVTHSTSSSGREYITTKPDATKKDNLLSLPRF